MSKVIKHIERYNTDDFLLIGISYKTAHVDIREKFSFSKDALSEAVKEITDLDGVTDCVLISTCNRTEIYTLNNDTTDAVVGNIQRYILEKAGMDESFLDHLYTVRGKQVIDHLYQVTCGLDSLIFGEPQIFGQVKHAYAVACDAQCTGPVFNRLFHNAFQVGKHIRNNTGINKGIVSLSSAAVMMGKKIHGCLKDRDALLIGTGKVGKMCAKQLIEAGIKNLYITNRTPEHALELADELAGKIVPFEIMREMLDKVEIIITSVTSPEPIISRQDVLDHRSKKKGKTLIFIDLGVPRNVAPDVANLANVHVFNIDSIESFTQENHNKRKKEVAKAQELIDEKVDLYCAWLSEREVVPIIHNLRETCEKIRQNELSRINNKVDAETFEAIDSITRRVVRKILHNPTITVRETETGSTRDRLLQSISDLFIAESSEIEGSNGMVSK